MIRVTVCVGSFMEERAKAARRKELEAQVERLVLSTTSTHVQVYCHHYVMLSYSSHCALAK